MSGIVCAVRGGPGSHYTRREALAQAAASDTPLYLLVVVSPGSYGALHEGEQRAIRAEMAWRELALARSNAARLGSPDTQFNIQIRIGELDETIAEFVREVDAHRLLVGAPRQALDTTLTADRMAVLVIGWRTTLGIEVEVVAPGRDGAA